VTRAKAGAPRIQGRLEGPTAAFLLASDLKADGDITVVDAVARVVADWKRQAANGTIQMSTINAHTGYLMTFAQYAPNRGARRLSQVTSQLLWDWVNSVGPKTVDAPTETTRKTRRAVARGFYRTAFCLGLTEANPAASLPTVKSPARVVSALTDEEVARAKAAASWEVPIVDGRTRRYEEGSLTGPVALALTLLGAQPGEVGAIRGRDLRLLDGLVWAHGGGDRFDDRWLPIDDTWAYDTLLARQSWLERNRPNAWLDQPIAYDRQPKTPDTHAGRSAATSMTLDKVLAKAGLKQPGRIRVASINEWVAARVYRDTQRVEAVAARLGMRSLDAAAHLVAWDWRPQFTTRGPQEES
jgi:hypothetical protein